MALFQFACLIYNQGTLSFFSFRAEDSQRASSLDTVIINVPFEVLCALYQALLWTNMSLMRKLVFPVVFSAITLTPYMSPPYVAVWAALVMCLLSFFYVLWNTSVGFTQPLSHRA